MYASSCYNLSMVIKNAKFLLIDDDPFIREELIKSLKILDFTGPFIEACDGQEAINIIKENHSAPFDFIFCDVHMPNMDGISFLTTLKTEQLLEVPTPILMLTSENNPKVVLESVKQGVGSYLLKPWNQIELAKKIVTVWEKVHRLND